MIARKKLRQFVIAMLIGAPVLVPAIAGAESYGSRLDPGLEQAAGRGTIVLPNLYQEGLVVASILGESGAHYGLDGMLTTWIPSDPFPELMFGGFYGRLFQASPSGQEMKARVEGTWRMLDQTSGQLEAQVIDDSGQVIGLIRAKFLVDHGGEGIEVGNAAGRPGVLAGEIGLEMQLAE